MPTERPWLEPCYSRRLLRPFLDHLARTGCSSATVEELSALDVEARVPLRTVLCLLQDHEVDMPDLGIAAALRMRVGGGGLTYYVASSTPTVGDALHALVRYVRLLNEAAQFDLRVHGGVAYLQLGSSVPLPHSSSDFQSVLIWRCVSCWMGRTAEFELWFKHAAPRSLQAHEAALPGVALRFAASADAIVFDARLLALPLATADAELHDVLKRKADEELALLPVMSRLSLRVYELLLAAMHASRVDSSWVAAKLGMSRRSLSRHLEIEHTSYTEILGNARREVARHLLRRTNDDIQEIAARLGYSHAGAFSRAFKRWEGENPQLYRMKAGTDRSAQPAQLVL